MTLPHSHPGLSMVHKIMAAALLLVPATGAAAAAAVLSPTHYDLECVLDYSAEMLRGTAHIQLENRSAEPQPTASLLLYRLMKVRTVRDDAGRDLAFTQSVVAFEDFGKLQVNQIVVTFAAPLAPGARTAIRIEYEGYLLGYAETGMEYVRDRIDRDFTILRDDSYAYPQPGYPSSAINRSAPLPSFTYSARITVPRDLVVANGGQAEATEVSGNVITYRFSSLKPSWRMDFAIAHYTLLSAGSVRVYYLPGDGVGAAAVARAAGQGLELFNRWFGPLNHATAFTFIEIPDGWGSQADVTTVIQTAAAFRDRAQHHQIYHELSHLWNVPPTDLPSPRWNEGMASFLEYLATQELTGDRVVDSRAQQLLDKLRAGLPGHPEWQKVPFVDYGRADLTDLAYSAGALFFDLLYRRVGQDRFNRIIGDYYAAYNVHGGSTRDFLEAIRKGAGVDVSLLINDWFLTPAWTDRVRQSTGIKDLASPYGIRPIIP